MSKYSLNFKKGDTVNLLGDTWEIIEVDYQPNKVFKNPFVFQGKDMKQLRVNLPKTSKDAIGYKVKTKGKLPMVGFMYQHGNFTKLATTGVNEGINETWSTYEQKMVNQILRAKKEGTPIYILPMKTQEFYRKHKDKFNESVNEVAVGDYVKSEYGFYYKRVDGKVGGQEAYVRVDKGKVGKRKTGLYDMTKVKKVSEKEALGESINEAIEPEDYLELRQIIRQEISSVFFDLFKKRSTWMK